MSASNWVHLDVKSILEETDKALLLELMDGRKTWIPLSQISDSDIYRKGDKDTTVSVTEWIADKSNL